jgi:hypothetical protein
MTGSRPNHQRLSKQAMKPCPQLHTESEDNLQKVVSLPSPFRSPTREPPRPSTERASEVSSGGRENGRDQSDPPALFTVAVAHPSSKLARLTFPTSQVIIANNVV